ncbi:cytidylate kinase-like family protein [Oscillochloris sp. ZM17-4]|uniref:cytidylate kinase-like family protein n=1 Tax=Oscillochloris sp. ZM17-4 TaxID=2866714 RepID=UPI001C735885|nr:cytidylate kinase-like family protein [Oscillochloris sp. ZM17-4]MBX0326659.1 cytidylate kinase-like family protein [Oscillochloris sp. ZM17-4]
MTVITIEYQMGCGGRDIARKLAELLGFSYVDREIVRDVAHELHIAEDMADAHDERMAGLLDRAMTMLWAAGELAGGAASAEVAPAPIDDTLYHQVTCQVIEAAARRSKVIIVGHGASFALAGWPGVMHVGLYAPMERRVTTIMGRLKVSQAEAERRITQRDHDRARYIKQFYNANWREADHYHLMIDTAQLTPEQVVALIAQAWRTSALGVAEGVRA